jgi:DNA-binding CsgD family transcriptional regulator
VAPEPWDTPFAAAVAAERRAAAAQDAPDAAVAAERWAAAADLWTAARRPYERAWARLREADALFAARDRDAARTALHDIAADADALGARPLRAAAEDLAARARVAAAPTRRHRPDPTELTDREREVLRLLAEGRTNPQVAADLFLSVKTVGSHVSRVLAKLGAATRGEAVANARRRGLLD